MTSDTILSVIKSRRSIRAFGEEPPDRETVKALVEAAGFAPSAGNRQDWFFTAVYSREVRNRMGEAVRVKWNKIIEDNSGQGFIEEMIPYIERFADFADAPVVLVVSSMKVPASQRHLLEDEAEVVVGSRCSVAMAAQNLILYAHSLGLGSCVMTGALAARGELADIIELDKRREIVCLVTLGRPAESPEAPSRKPVNEIVRILE
ncbi:MAG: nitroreductase family protein [Planctomycetota bacterium]|jgi:nitroreductase